MSMFLIQFQKLNSHLLVIRGLADPHPRLVHSTLFSPLFGEFQIGIKILNRHIHSMRDCDNVKASEKLKIENRLEILALRKACASPESQEQESNRVRTGFLR